MLLKSIVFKKVSMVELGYPHGIKVRLDTGEVGRVKEIIEEKEIDWPE